MAIANYLADLEKRVGERLDIFTIRTESKIIALREKYGLGPPSGNRTSMRTIKHEMKKVARQRTLQRIYQKREENRDRGKKLPQILAIDYKERFQDFCKKKFTIASKLLELQVRFRVNGSKGETTFQVITTLNNFDYEAVKFESTKDRVILKYRSMEPEDPMRVIVKVSENTSGDGMTVFIRRSKLDQDTKTKQYDAFFEHFYNKMRKWEVSKGKVQLHTGSYKECKVIIEKTRNASSKSAKSSSKASKSNSKSGKNSSKSAKSSPKYTNTSIKSTEARTSNV